MLLQNWKEKTPPILLGILFVLILTALLYTNPPLFRRILNYFDNISYDLRVRYEHKPVAKDIPIAIIDIDDKSLHLEGRWPWKRSKLGELISKLYELNVKVVALDFIFPEKDYNQVEEVIQELKKQTNEQTNIAIADLESIKDTFDFDAILAKDLSTGNSILGFVLTNQGEPIGIIPPPLMTLSEQQKRLFIPEKTSYIGNIAIIQKSAKGGGFINATPDADGIIRVAPMLLRYEDKLYPSLSLEATRLFLSDPSVQLSVAQYGEDLVLEGIELGKKEIPVDPWGRVLIPFRGGPFSIPHISAADILNGNIEKHRLENFLVFVGSSATAIGDFASTAIAPVFPSIEIHAQIASGILDEYFPYRPAWGKGAATILVLGLGIIFAFLLPFLGPIFSFLLTIFFIFVLLAMDHFIWTNYQIVFSSIYPILTIGSLFILNEIYGYLFEAKRRVQMKSIFGQYVPPDCIDSMLKKGGNFGLEGEVKELTVLFSDIRNFTSVSEKLSASELKGLLNEYFTPMTQIIFDEKGTIDKYVGDMIMAFWGAPLKDLDHPLHAVRSAFSMQKKLQEINKEGKPEIRIGIGINTGTMNVGDMGSKFRRAYTVLGDSVNLASRLEGATKIYHVGILVGENTYEKTKDLVVYRKIDRVRVKGKEKGVDIYEPISLLRDAPSEMLEHAKLHNLGMEAYFQKNWDESEKIFQKLKESDPNKTLYDLYLARISQFRVSAPGSGWEIFNLESK